MPMPNLTGDMNMTWSKSDIQQARKVPLAPLLRNQGYALPDTTRVTPATINASVHGGVLP